MRRTLILVALLGCDRAPSDPVGKTGTLALSLIGEGDDGSEYQLQGAMFSVDWPFHGGGVSGTSTVTVGPGGPGDTEVTAELPPGDYTVALHPGWALAPLGQPDEPVWATLASPNPRQVSIDAGSTAALTFAFDLLGPIGVGNGPLPDFPVPATTPTTSTETTPTTTDEPDGLLLYVTFDDDASVTTPSIGPSGTILVPGSFTAGYLGNALSVTATTPVLRYVCGPPDPADPPCAWVIPPDRGTIEFWARLDTLVDTQPAWSGSPIFVQTTLPVPTAYVVEINGNDGWGGAGLVGWAGNGNFGTGCYSDSYPYDSLLGASGVYTWHHYALVWDIDGLSGTSDLAQVFVDGVSTSTTSICGENHQPSDFAESPELDIGSAQVAGIGFSIDELRVWDHVVP